MIGVKQLIVSLNWGTEEVDIGELVLADNRIYFKYYVEFLSEGSELSPINLPLSDQIYEAPSQNIEGLGGLHGLFSDSLPDGWGRLLLDRALSAKNINPYDISPLDRLAYVGQKGFGALNYRPKYDLDVQLNTPFELDHIAAEIDQVYKGTSSEIIDELFLIGGSPGGARPKVTVGYNPATDQLVHGIQTLPDQFEHWLIKFPATTDEPDIAQIEFAYSEMAKACKIEMSDCLLFNSKSGKTYFGTKRFDRIGNNRMHLHSAAGILEDNFRRSNLDYGHLMDTAFRLERDVKGYEKVLRLATFNVYAHNKDDHSKNFAFLMNRNGEWRFSPGYDLTFSTSNYGMQSTMVAGESRAPGKIHLMKLAETFSIKNPEKIIEEVISTISDWTDFAESAGVSTHSTQKISKALKEIGRR